MLWKKLVEKALREDDINSELADQIAQRRAYPRRSNDRCVSLVNDSMMPVMNWSMSGVLVNGDDRLYNIGDELDLTLKYKTSKGIIEVQQGANVVRKGGDNIALEFKPLDKDTFNNFQRVIDDDAATRFAASQI